MKPIDLLIALNDLNLGKKTELTVMELEWIRVYIESYDISMKKNSELENEIRKKEKYLNEKYLELLTNHNEILVELINAKEKLAEFQREKIDI